MANLLGSAVTAVGDRPPQSVNSLAHARSRFTVSVLDATVTSSDIIIWGLFKPSDIFIDLNLFSDGNPSSTGAIDVGLHSVDMSNGGLTLTEVDEDLFASAQSIVTALPWANKTDVFGESTTLDPIMDRGKALWELAAIGLATYTEDPGGVFALTSNCTATFDAAAEVGVLVNYVAGD